MLIGIINDIHEDLISLKKAIGIFEKKNCTEIICLGDIVGFDPNYHTHSDSINASECINIIKQNCRHIVAGNHDIYALDRHALEFNNSNYEINYDNMDYHLKYHDLNYNDLPVKNFTVKDYEFIESLSFLSIAHFSEFIVLLSHSVFPDISGKSLLRLSNPWEFSTHINFLKHHHCSFSLGGHQHPEGIIKSDNESIQLFDYVELPLNTKPVHYSLPNLVSTNGKSGVTIIDFNSFTIEAIQISNNKNYWKKMNGWLKNK